MYLLFFEFKFMLDHVYLSFTLKIFDTVSPY